MPGPAKIAFVVSGDLPSRHAHSLQAMQMARALGICGNEVRVFAPDSARLAWRRSRGDARAYGPAAPGNVEWIPAGGAPWRTTRFAGWGVRALAAIRAWNPDLVYARDYDAPRETIRAGIPTVVEKHSPVVSGSDVGPLLSLGGEPAFRALVVVTESLGRLHRDAGFPPGKVVVEPDGVDLDLFPSPGPVPGVGPVVYAGSLAPWKGIGTLLGAATLLRGVRFEIVGGTATERLRWRLRDAPRNARFLPRVPHDAVPGVLARARAVVIPNTGEGISGPHTSPLKLFESMASGRPIVATDIPPLREVLRHEENAWLVPPRDPGALADGIRWVLEERSVAASLARRARSDSERYDWRARARRILARGDLAP